MTYLVRCFSEGGVFFGKISLTKMPIGLRMQAMAEFKHDTEDVKLEQEFRDLETKLTDRIKIAYKESLKKYPAGVSVEIASDEDKDFRLYIDSNGNWDGRCQMMGWDIGVKPNLSRLLDNFLCVTDKDYREFSPEIQTRLLHANRCIFTKNLIGRMQETLTRLD